MLGNNANVKIAQFIYLAIVVPNEIHRSIYIIIIISFMICTPRQILFRLSHQRKKDGEASRSFGKKER
jgi:hypothetical protein